MWGVAIFGSIFTLLGVVSFFVPVHEMQMFGRPVTTNADKVIWTVLNAALGAAGIGSIAWTTRGERPVPHSKAG